LDPLGIGPLIRHWRERRGISRDVLAGLIGKSTSWVEMAETGRRAPYRIDDLARIAAALRVDLGTLLTTAVADQADDQRQQLLKMLRDAFQSRDPQQGLAMVAQRLAVGEADADLMLIVEPGGAWRIVKRRELGKYGAALALSLAADPMLDPERGAELVTSLETHRLGMSGVDALRAVVGGWRRLDDELGSASLRSLVLHNLRVVDGLGRAGPAEPVARELRLVHAELAQFSGWLSYDMGDADDAAGHYRTALRSAEQASDDAMAAHVLGWISYLASTTGDPQEGIRAADASLQRAAKTPSRTLRASLARMKARAHAHAGEAGACERALGRAQTELAAADPADDPAFIYWFDEAVLLAHAGIAYLLLDRPEPARAALERSLALANPAHVRDRAFHLTWLASSHAKAGEVSEACRVSLHAAGLLEQTSSERSVRRLRELHGALRPHWRRAEVRELGDRLFAL